MRLLSFSAGHTVVTSKTPETVALFGLPISNVTMAEAVSYIEHAIEEGGIHQIATANLDFARNALRDEALQRVICECSLVLPDGAPMVWAARLLGKPIKERVTGVDLVPQLAQLSAAKGYRIFFLGSTDERSAHAQRVLEERYPGVAICGRLSPPVTSIEKMDNEKIVRHIRWSKPDILLVAFGNPKQEFWIYQFRKYLHIPVMIGIGGSLDMISGSVRRAPPVFQKLSLEWFYRMAQEPVRLLPRYMRDAVALARHLPVGFAVHQMQSSQEIAGHVQVNSHDAIRELTLPTRLSGPVCVWLTREVHDALNQNQHVLVCMRDVHRVDPDGLGCLMEARRLLHAQGCTLWLTEISPTVLRVLEYSAVKGLFFIAETTREAVRLSTIGIPESGGSVGQLRGRTRGSRQRQHIA